MPDIIATITEFGSIGVIAVLLWLSWDKDKRFTRLVSNHLEHEIESRDDNTKALVQLVETIRTLQDRFDRK